MRAQCVICSDLFENAGNLNIAAVPCGHTFHEECLMTWLGTSSTCPTCRKQVKKNQIIKRLFFDIREEYEETESDPDSLHNKISTLKAQLCDIPILKREIVEAQEKLSTELACKEVVQGQLKKAEMDKAILQKHLAHIGQEHTAYQKELTGYDATKKKLKRLENVQLMLQGTETDVDEMVKCQGDGGEGAIKQLSSMVVVMKREYTKALEDKSTLRTENREVNKQFILARNELNLMRREFKDIQLKLKESNQNVIDLDKRNNLNRRKVAHLRNALKHQKTEGSQSFIAAVNEDSPNVAYTPPPPPPPPSTFSSTSSTHPSTKRPLQRDNDENENSNSTNPNSVRVKHCQSPDLFDENEDDDNDSAVIETVSNKLNNARCSSSGSDVGSSDIYNNDAPSMLKMVRISSAADKFKAAKLRKIESERDAAPSLPFSSFTIMQKKMTGISSSRPLALLKSGVGLPKSRTYNGFGGSTKVDTFETPFRPSTFHSQALKRKATKKRCPLSSKPLTNQPKLKECLPTASSTPTSISISDRKSSSSSSSSSSIASITSQGSKNNKNEKDKKKQFIVNNMFAKNVNKNKTVVSLSCSTTPVFLSRPENGIIDLT